MRDGQVGDEGEEVLGGFRRRGVSSKVTASTAAAPLLVLLGVSTNLAAGAAGGSTCTFQAAPGVGAEAGAARGSSHVPCTFRRLE